MSAPSPTDGDDGKVFVLGLDGVPWNMLTDWVTEAEFPNLHRILTEGATGPLQSTTPAVTPCAWPSITTGVWPDKHGVYSFQKLTADHTHRMYTNADVNQPALWEIVSRSVACNVPVTYPATEMDGTLVAGTMTPTMDDEYTWPPELREEIKEEVPNHRISLRWGEYLDKQDEFVNEIETLVESRRQLLEFLESRTDDWQLFFFTVMAPDRLQHLVWDEDVLKDHYQQLDELVGDVLSIVESEDANLFVVSDHGFGPVSRAVCVNRILETNGYLVRQDSGARTLLEELGITKSNLRAAMSRAGINVHDFIKNYVPRSFVNQVASNVPGEHTVYDIDSTETKAIVHGMGNVYINSTERFKNGSVKPGEVEPLKRELKRLFTSFTDPKTNEQPLDVYDGDTVFPTDPEAPDLVVEAAPEYTLSTSLTSTEVKEPTEDADHRKHGVFMAWGPDVEAGTSLSGLSVVDVAPTVLHSLAKPIPEQTDGRVVEEVFTSGSVPGRLSVSTQAYERGNPSGSEQIGDMDEVKTRLKGLGYMED